MGRENRIEKSIWQIRQYKKELIPPPPDEVLPPESEDNYTSSSETMTVVKNIYNKGEHSIPSSIAAGATEYADGEYYYGTSDNSSNKYASPYTATYNVSNDWDLGTAIPTTETYTNQLEQDTWYGIITLNHNTLTYDVTLRVSKPYRYWVTTRYRGYWVYGSYPVPMTYTFVADKRNNL